MTRGAALSADPAATSARATATETTLYLAIDNRITPVALSDLTADTSWTAPDTVTGMEPATDGGTLYVSLRDRVLALDRRTFIQRKEVDVPATEPIDHVAPALAPLANSDYVKCAC